MSKAANVPSVVTSTVVVALVLLLCSCGGKEPLQFGNLELSGKTIEDSAPSSGVAPPKDWPQACSLIAKSEVRSLLPNSKVSLVGKKVEILKGRGVDYTVPGGQCQVESHQPGGRSNYSDVVWIDVMAWGRRTQSGTGFVSQTARPTRIWGAASVRSSVPSWAVRTVP
jgi:predicted small lipoprotein YifL